MSSKFSLPAKALVLLGIAVAAGGVCAQSVSISGGVPVTQTFDSMAGAQGTTSSVLPTGWFLFENGSGANTTYLIDDGSSQSGNTFSYGGNGQTDRAFGSLASGSVVANIGARLQNDTGSTLTEILIEYTGEQWRLGTPGGADKLDFQYCTTTCALNDAANAPQWVNFDVLDLVAPVTAGTEGTILNGNLAANQVVKSQTLTGLSLANAAQMWIRWVDTNDAAVDDALAVEDFRVGPAVDNPPVVANTSPLNTATSVAINSNLVVTFSEPVNTDPGAFTLSCTSNASYPITVSGTGNTRTINPDVDFAFGDSCTATVVAANVNDLDGTLDDMAANHVWTFTTVVDTAPTIASTLPTSGATGIAVNAVVVINFSEPVNPTIPWITLTCNSVGYTGTLVGSNGNATWTLDPFTNFNNGDVCTVLITGANVVDVDGAPNAVAGNPSFSFTIAPDVAPTITSTYPVHLDVNVPAASNLTVVFSEPVTVQAGAFSISCVGSGVHTFVQTDTAQTQYTLNPDDDFTAGENCTFDITANLVTDIDGAADQLGANVRIDFNVGAGVAGYYERVDTSSCRALRATLHGVIDDHSAVAYSDAGNDWTPGVPSTYDVWEVLNLADEDPLDPTKILDIYRNESYTKITGGTGIYNREHVWPNSQGFNNLDTLDGFPNSPYTDTHMLMASNTDYNARRGSRLFGTCNPGSTPSCTVDATIANASNGVGGGATGYTTPTGHNWYTNGSDGNNGSYEVWNHRRGDLARGMLYMDVRYEGGRNSRNFQREPQLILTDNRSLVIITNSYAAPAYSGLLTPILAWHNADLPTAREGIRNAMIESVQGNRNPFVDHPEWANTLFSGTCTGPDFVAVDDDFTGTEDAVLNRNSVNDVGVLNDDQVFAGATSLSVNTVPVVAPLHGNVALSSNGQFVYTPTANYCGKDTFTYSVSNGTLADTAVAHIDLVCVNDLPVTVGSISNVSVNAGSPLNVVTATAFNDVDGDDLVYSISSVPTLPATISINAGTGVISGTPLVADAGVYTVTVRATEPAPLTGFVTQTFTLTIVGETSLIFSNGFE
jgi:endonuclease I